MNKTDSKVKNLIIRCPSCGKSCRYDESNEFRPFCCERCQIIDRGAWAEEKYTVPAEDADPWTEE